MKYIIIGVVLGGLLFILAGMLFLESGEGNKETSLNESLVSPIEEEIYKGTINPVGGLEPNTKFLCGTNNKKIEYEIIPSQVREFQEIPDTPIKLIYSFIFEKERIIKQHFVL